MEGLNLQLLLLEESIGLSNVALKTTADGEQLADWMTPSPTDIPNKSIGLLIEQSAINQGKKNNVKRSEQSASVSRLPVNRRTFSASGTQWNKNRHTLDVKFEHFRDASDYIEQYRKAKLSRLKEAFNNLPEQHKTSSLNLKTVESCHSAESCHITQNVPKEAPCLESQRSGCVVTPTNNHSSEIGRHDFYAKGQNDVLTKPSLPRTGFFSGKKWVYSKNVTSSALHSGGKRHTGPCFKGKQQARSAENMCLKGTGKPLNVSLNKTWTVPLFRRKVCKSAPSSAQRSLKKDSPSRLGSHTIDCIPIDILSKSQHFVDFSSLHNGAANRVSKPTKSCSFKHLRKVEEIPEQDNQQCLDYENMFKDVIDFYGHSKQDRSQVYVRIGS